MFTYEIFENIIFKISSRLDYTGHWKQINLTIFEIKKL